MNRLFLLLFGAVSLVAHAQVPDYVPTEGLVAWYPFNGNANDESGNGHHGEEYGIATLMIDLMAVRWLLHAVNPNSQLGCSYQLN